MNDLRTAAQQALEVWGDLPWEQQPTALYPQMDALRAALAQEQAEPGKEPVAVVRTWHKGEEQHAELLDWGIGIDALPDGKHTLYTAPPQREPLTDEEIDRIRAAEREAIMDEWSACVQSDLENGVRWLNEQAAKKWQQSYPAMAGFADKIYARGEQDER